MNLNEYLQKGAENVLRAAGRFYMRSAWGRRFVAGLMQSQKKAAVLRRDNEAAGLHVPPFLIASVATQCNLHCAGCYARAGEGCGDACSSGTDGQELTAAQWGGIFTQSVQLGTGFILLAGGEPLLRPDVLEEAARHKEIVFPVFTNGTLLNEKRLDMLAQNPHIIPVLSLEGDAAQTDARRGAGVSEKLAAAMRGLKARGLLFGVSITVTSQNIAEVAREDYIAALCKAGCGLVVFVEYVPAEAGSEALVPDEKQASALLAQTARLKKCFADTIFLNFPGDEEYMGGCLAAGRGFFHINAAGGAEPCPFSPYSELSLATSTVEQVLRSPFFAGVRTVAHTPGVAHAGGCELFHKAGAVQALLQKGADETQAGKPAV